MQSSPKRALLIGLQVLLLAAFALAIEHWWGFARLLTPWSQVPLGLVAIVVAAQLASYSLRALRVYLAERRIPRGRWAACLQLILLNNALNLLLPARTGEASFPILLQRWFAVPLAEGAGTLLWLRLLDLSVLGTLAAAVLTPKLLPAAALPPLLLASAASPLIALALARVMATRGVDRPGRIGRLLATAATALPQTALHIARDFALCWAAWGVKLAALALVFAQLAALPTATALLGAIGGDLSTVLPIHTPGGFGTYEAGVIALASPLAAATPALLAAAVNLHILVLGIALAGGAIAWLSRPRVTNLNP